MLSSRNNRLPGINDIVDVHSYSNPEWVGIIDVQYNDIDIDTSHVETGTLAGTTAPSLATKDAHMCILPRQLHALQPASQPELPEHHTRSMRRLSTLLNH